MTMIVLAFKKNKKPNFSTGKADLVALVRPFQPLEPVALQKMSVECHWGLRNNLGFGDCRVFLAGTWWKAQMTKLFERR